MRALSIRQPFAELILSGMKRIEYRTRPTRIIGERFWIYASKGKATQRRSDGATEGIWSRDVGVADKPLPPWMIELAEGLRLWKPGDLPTGVIVGSAVIDRCAHVDGMYQWHLKDVERVERLRKPARQPQPAWFNPF